MCGITGAIFHQSGHAPADLEKSLSVLQHRGPDATGRFISECVLLGHTRLAIIDLDSGRQPLRSASGDLHLVANGEIYNYPEISARYPRQSEQALTRSDSEAIFQAYQSQGITGLKELRGMFAFALHDAGENLTLLCRDRLGIKPLYFCRTASAVFFASEIKALLPYLPRQPALNPDALAQFLQHQFNSGRQTIFEGIQRVLPGELIIVKDGKLRFEKYWDSLAVAPRELSLTAAMEEFDGLFDEVMRQHMRADVPFGLFLSGGIDSSILLSRLAKLHGPGLLTYSIGFSGTNMADELEAANRLAARFGTRHHPLRISRDELFTRIVHSIWAADDLMRDYASLPTHALAESAARDVKVIFSGEGGDEAFAGYKRYQPGPLRWAYHTLLGKSVRVHNQWRGSARRRCFIDALLRCDSKKPFTDAWRASPPQWSTMARRQYVDINTSLCDNLFVKTDRMMMAFGLEGRVPFADHRLIEFGLSLPDHLKYKQSRGKRLLREWAKQHLPHDHLAKPKRGFHVPVQEWLSGDFLDQLGQKLVANTALKEWFNSDGMRQILHAHSKGKNYSREIWGMMQFAIWHKLFVENPGVRPTPAENPLDWI